MPSIGKIRPLKSSNSQLRLLKFVSEVGVDVPSVELEAVSTDDAFSKENPLRYHAISYTWGSRNPQKPIVVDKGEFEVNLNCRKLFSRPNDVFGLKSRPELKKMLGTIITGSMRFVSINRTTRRRPTKSS